jgi:hypothetical protein
MAKRYTGAVATYSPPERSGWFKHDRHPSISASWAHETRLQTREGKVRATSGNQRLEVELLAIDAAPHGSRFLTIAVGAAHMHLPAKAARYAEGLDFR